MRTIHGCRPPSPRDITFLTSPRPIISYPFRERLSTSTLFSDCMVYRSQQLLISPHGTLLARSFPLHLKAHKSYSQLFRFWIERVSYLVRKLFKDIPKNKKSLRTLEHCHITRTSNSQQYLEENPVSLHCQSQPKESSTQSTLRGRPISRSSARERISSAA